MSTVLSSLPAWRLIDPLPVLAYMGRADEEDDEQTDQEESLESIVEGGEPGADDYRDDETYDPLEGRFSESSEGAPSRPPSS